MVSDRYCPYCHQLFTEIWSFLKLLHCFWVVVVVPPVLSAFLHLHHASGFNALGWYERFRG